MICIPFINALFFAYLKGEIFHSDQIDFLKSQLMNFKNTVILNRLICPPNAGIYYSIPRDVLQDSSFMWNPSKGTIAR